jgi:hypothetical protein
MLTSANCLPTRHHTHCLPSARYSWNRDSSVKSTLLQRASGHWRWAFAHWRLLRCLTAVRSRPWWGRLECRWASLRMFLTVCAEILWLCKPRVSSAVRMAGHRWSHRWRDSQLHAPCKLETSVALCCVTKLYILEWPFIVPSARCTCVMIMLFNQLLDMPHLSGGWIILAKAKCSLTGLQTNLCTAFERNNTFCEYGTFLESIISAHETWDHFTCCVSFFSSIFNRSM